MKIIRVTYIENGYFQVKYSQITNQVVQDIGAIKMTVPTDPSIKEILMFLRSLKIENLQNEEFDDLKYRDHIVVQPNDTSDDDHAMYAAFSKNVF